MTRWRTTVRAEEHALPSESAARTCLADGCNAEVPRGKQLCLKGHPTDTRHTMSVRLMHIPKLRKKIEKKKEIGRVLSGAKGEPIEIPHPSMPKLEGNNKAFKEWVG